MCTCAVALACCDAISSKVDAVADLKKSADCAVKTFNISPERKSFTQTLSSFKKTMQKIERERKLSTDRSGTTTVLQSIPPLVTITLNILRSKGETNLSTSAFEAKAGNRAAVVTPSAGRDPASTFTTVAKMKKLLKDISIHLKTNTSANSSLPDQPTKNKVLKELKHAFEPSLFATLVVPNDEGWAQKIFMPQLWGATGGHVQCGYSPFCMMDCRMVLEGSETIAGIALAAIPGNNLKEKRKFVFMQAIDKISELITAGGFIFSHDSSKIAVLPTGFLYIICSDTLVRGIRWSCSSDDPDTNRVKCGLADITASYPEVGNLSTGYAQYRDWLSAMG